MIPLPSVFLDRPIAHRALHGEDRPENSMAAVRAAVAAGYGIEIDIQPAADATAMVFHDDDLDRVTLGKGPISEQTVQALAKLDYEASTERGVPTLSSVLDFVAGRVPLLIEIKDQDGGLGANVGLLEDAVARSLLGYDGPAAVMSFNPHSVAKMAEFLPDVPRGLTTDPFEPSVWPSVPVPRLGAHRRMEMIDAVGASFISHNCTDLAAAPVRAFKDRGLPVLCWTVRSAKAETEARQIADNITFEGYLP